MHSFEQKDHPFSAANHEGLRKRVSKLWAFHVTSSSSAWQNMTKKTERLGPIQLSPRPGALSCVQEIRCIRHLHQLWWSNMVNFLQIIYIACVWNLMTLKSTGICKEFRTLNFQTHNYYTRLSRSMVQDRQPTALQQPPSSWHASAWKRLDGPCSTAWPPILRGKKNQENIWKSDENMLSSGFHWFTLPGKDHSENPLKITSSCWWMDELSSISIVPWSCWCCPHLHRRSKEVQKLVYSPNLCSKRSCVQCLATGTVGKERPDKDKSPGLSLRGLLLLAKFTRHSVCSWLSKKQRPWGLCLNSISEFKHCVKVVRECGRLSLLDWTSDAFRVIMKRLCDCVPKSPSSVQASELFHPYWTRKQSSPDHAETIINWIQPNTMQYQENPKIHTKVF